MRDLGPGNLKLSGSRSFVDIARTAGLFGAALTAIGLAPLLVRIRPVWRVHTAVCTNAWIFGWGLFFLRHRSFSLPFRRCTHWTKSLKMDVLAHGNTAFDSVVWILVRYETLASRQPWAFHDSDGNSHGIAHAVVG